MMMSFLILVKKKKKKIKKIIKTIIVMILMTRNLKTIKKNPIQVKKQQILKATLPIIKKRQITKIIMQKTKAVQF
jgi:hypothetical protein